MSANCRFLLNNLVDLALTNITASSEETELPARNVTTLQRTERWSATGNVDEYLDINLPNSDHKVSVVALTGFGFQWSTGGTFRVLAYTDPSRTTSVYDSGWLPVWEASMNPYGAPWVDYFGANLLDVTVPRIFFIPSSMQYLFWRIEFSDLSGGPISIGRVYLGDYFEPARGFLRGWQERWSDNSVVTPATMGGQVYIRPRHHRRMVNLVFNSLTSDEIRDSVATLLRSAHSTPVWVCLDPTDAESRMRSTYYGRLAGPSHAVVARGIGGTRRSVSLAFQEDL